MALSLDPATRVVSVPQADLTLVTGTLYAMDTDQFRKDLFDLLSSENYIWMPDAFIHNTEVTVAGTTFARTLEMINNYSVEFIPDSQWSVRLEGSNNNLFDVENGILAQNQVQVIPTNSAGLIKESGTPEKGTAFAFTIAMVQSTDHVSPLLGATVAANLSQDGGAIVAGANAVVEVGQGLYRVSLTAAEMDFNEVASVFTATGADNRYVIIETSR